MDRKKSGRNIGRTAWAVGQLKLVGGSMICRNEPDARGVANKWGGTPRYSPRQGAATALNPNPKGAWFVDFEPAYQQTGESND